MDPSKPGNPFLPIGPSLPCQNQAKKLNENNTFNGESQYNGGEWIEVNTRRLQLTAMPFKPGGPVIPG